MPFFKFIFGLVIAMFVITAIVIVLFIGGAIWGVKKVNEKGLKNCVEQVWNGPTNTSVSTNTP